ncbi:MAG TPA: hypothetical protein VFN25_13240 [Dokdonella sp.]|uniref:hypothetical protein n=1 Tax=Dokdonella sp. TaxID=2291710 RepID=UPI002D802BF9|nr:hypothetical protein [Dokdonella sp.]HET9033853.1 hypothetical protein [Dokdonella sp.]
MGAFRSGNPLKRAARRYEDERRNVTGSRLGGVGHLRICAGGSSQSQDGSQYLAAVEQLADDYFSNDGASVRIGPLLQPTDDPVSNSSAD